jgi:predicted DNA-binding protein (MmcQ/YjbR family)
MNFDQAKRYLLNKPEALEDYPFYPDVAVFKVKGKMYATLSVDDGIARMNLKCDPEQALTLRFFFDGVKPGYHMNKIIYAVRSICVNLPALRFYRALQQTLLTIFSPLKCGAILWRLPISPTQARC